MTTAYDLIGEVLAPRSDHTLATKQAISDALQTAAAGCQDIAHPLTFGTDRWARLNVAAIALAAEARRIREEATRASTS